MTNIIDMNDNDGENEIEIVQIPISSHTLSILEPTSIRTLFVGSRELAVKIAEPHSLWLTHPVAVLIDAFLPKINPSNLPSIQELFELVDCDSHKSSASNIDLRRSIVWSIYRQRINQTVDDESTRRALLKEIDVGLSHRQVAETLDGTNFAIGANVMSHKFMSWLKRQKFARDMNRIQCVYLGFSGIESFAAKHDFSACISPNITSIVDYTARCHNFTSGRSRNIPGVLKHKGKHGPVFLKSNAEENIDKDEIIGSLRDESLIGADMRVEIKESSRRFLIHICNDVLHDEFSILHDEFPITKVRKNLKNDLSGRVRIIIDLLGQIDEPELLGFAQNVSGRVDKLQAVSSLEAKISAAALAASKATFESVELFRRQLADFQIAAGELGGLEHLLEASLSRLENNIAALEASAAAISDDLDDDIMIEAPVVEVNSPAFDGLDAGKTLYITHEKHSHESIFNSPVNTGNRMVDLDRTDRTFSQSRIYEADYNRAVRPDSKLFQRGLDVPLRRFRFDRALDRILSLRESAEAVGAQRLVGKRRRGDRAACHARHALSWNPSPGLVITGAVETRTRPPDPAPGRYQHPAYSDDAPPRYDKPERLASTAGYSNRTNGRMMTQRQLNLYDVEAWAGDERSESAEGSTRRTMMNTLINQIEHDRNLPQPDALPPGSPERLIAEARQRRLATLATTLGYQPAGREIATEIVKHVALSHAPIPEIGKKAIEAAGPDSGSDNGKNKSEDRDKKTRARYRSSNKRNDPGISLGFGFDR